MSSPQTATTPINVTRYNPNKDSGKGNTIYLISTLISTYTKPTDPILKFSGLPVWMLLYGFLQYVTTMKKDKNYLDSYMLAIECPAFEPAPQIGASYWCIPIDKDFIEGKGPYGTYVSTSSKTAWYPNVWAQLKTLNTFVECGPYIPKYSEERNSNWELHYKYDFLFKWGGPEITDPAVTDPATQDKYDVPDTYSQTIQIRNPAKQKQHQYSMHGITEGALLQKELLRECQNTSKLIQLSKQIQTQYHQRRKRSQDQHSKTHKKAKKRSRAVSFLSSKAIPPKKHKKHQTSSSSSTSSENTSNNSSTTSSD